MWIGGCRREPAEQRIRTLLAEAEQAAEKKDIAALRRLISERYRDPDGNDRRTVDGLLRLYFLRNESIHLFTRISEVNVTPPDRAQAVVFVAMTARPVLNAEELAERQADLHRFELTLAEEQGQWRVLQAVWRRAELSDWVYSGPSTR